MGKPFSSLALFIAQFCPPCLKTLGKDYGFEDGKEYSLAEFKQKDDQFKRDKSLEMATVDQIEAEFWRLLEFTPAAHGITVEYGADLHSSIHGSGFPTVEKQPKDTYSYCKLYLSFF